MNFVNHIKSYMQGRLSHLHNLRRITKYLTVESTKTLVHALIIGRLHYCNSLLYGLPDVHIKKLQRIQNAAAGLVTRVPRFDHITPALCKLHWLPIRCRIEFKLLGPVVRSPIKLILD